MPVNPEFTGTVVRSVGTVEVLPLLEYPTMNGFELTDLRPAERRLLDAARAGDTCDLIDRLHDPTPAEVADWNDPDREVRADFSRC